MLAKPLGLVVSPDGRRLYVYTGRGGRIVALDAKSLSVTGQAEIAGRPWGLVVVQAAAR